jgi:nitrate reductase assembly molybdenum cofactor insertion protein NarJ
MLLPENVDFVPDFTSQELETLHQLEKDELVKLLVQERRGWRSLLVELEEQHLSEWEALERDLTNTLEQCFSEQKNWASTLKSLSAMFSENTRP